MEPTRERNATLVDVLDRALNKGLLINADLIISVADIPLIGVNLQAAIAGMETMLEYGMMQDWDEAQRAAARIEQKKKRPPLINGEKIALEEFASHWHSQGTYESWRPGKLFVTDKRVFLFRKEPAEMLFATALAKINGLQIKKNKFLDREREELHILLENGKTVRLHAKDCRKAKEAIENTMREKQIIPKERALAAT